MQHLKIYMDVNDCVLNTSEAFIQEYCKKHNINKTFEDLKDNDYKSIDRNLNRMDFIKWLNDNSHWKNISMNEIFKNRYFEIVNEVVFITKKYQNPKNSPVYFTDISDSDSESTYDVNNLYQDVIKHHIENMLNDTIFIMAVENKTNIDLSDGIQVDDDLNQLNTNAKYKILLKNNHDADYNTIGKTKKAIPTENLYVANNMNDVFDIIKWIKIMEEKM